MDKKQHSNSLKESYERDYRENKSLAISRDVGGKQKAQNVMNLSSGISTDKVIEIGCGDGSVLKHVSNLGFCGSLYAVDISESAIEIVKAKEIPNLVYLELFDGYSLPFKDNEFDLAYCSHVMEHVEFPRVLLREIVRISKHQFFEIPIDFSFYVDRKFDFFTGYGHINIYTPSLFRFFLKTEGLEVVSDYCGFYTDEMQRLIHKGKMYSYLKAKFKNTIVNSIPYLRGVKPNMYAVLTRQKGSFKIF